MNAHMKAIFLFVPNYVYTTDIIRTGFLGKLSRNVRVVVYLPTLEYLSTFPPCENVEYRKWSVQSMRFWGYMKTVRLGLIREFDGLVSIQVHYRVGFKDWRRRMFRYIALALPFRISARFFTRLETLLLPMRKDLKTDFEKYKPVLSVVCTPGFTDFEAEAIILSKKLGIPTAGINFSWDNLTTNCKHIRHTDFLIAWNRFMKDEAVKYHGYPQDKVFVSGPMRFDRYFLKKPTDDKKGFIRSKGLDPDLPLVLLSTTSHGVYPYHSEIIDVLLKTRDSGRCPRFNILIRVHPKDDMARYESFGRLKDVYVEIPGHMRKLTGDSRHKIEMEERDMENLHNTLAYSDVAINYGSTITLEALACGTPVINVAYPRNPDRRHYEYVHYQPIVKSGAVRLAMDEADLAKAVCEHFENPDKGGDKRRALVEAFFYKTDGNASERCADEMKDIISQVSKQ